MKTQHTQTPWHVTYDSGTAIYGKIPEGSELVGHFTSPANAAFIVRAVNAHEELMEALKLAMKALEHWGNVAENIEKANDPVRLNTHGKLWEAIAKAEGR